MRQTVRTNNAAVVAAGALKPTSVYTVTRIENALVVIAHLSEGIPRHWLIDNASLEAFLASELEFGLRTAVEAKVLADVNGTRDPDAGVRDQRADHAAQGHHQARDGRLHRRRRSCCTRPIGRASSSRCRSRPRSSTWGCRTTRPPAGCSVCPVPRQRAGGRRRARIGKRRSRSGHRHARRRCPMVGERDRGLVRQEPRLRPVRDPLCDKRFQPARCGVAGPDRRKAGPRAVTSLAARGHRPGRAAIPSLYRVRQGIGPRRAARRQLMLGHCTAAPAEVRRVER